MKRKFLAALALCSAMAAPSAFAKTVYVPLPPERPAPPVSTEAPLEVVQMQVPDIIRSGNARTQLVDPNRVANDRNWDKRHNVGFHAEVSRSCDMPDRTGVTTPGMETNGQACR